MADILSIVLPVFALIAVGALAVRLGYVTPTLGDAVGTFAYKLALPALLFRTLTTAALPSTLPWGFWFAYFGGILVAWALGQVLALTVFRAAPREAVIAGLAVAQANTVMVGIPLVLNAYGPAAAVPVALILAANLPLTMATATLLFETQGAGGVGAVLRALVRALATHPLLLAIAAGFLTNLAGVAVPAALDAPLAALGGAGVPCALVSLGIALATHGVSRQVGLATTIAALKLVLTPAIVYVLGTQVVTLPPVYLAVAVVFAAAPVGVNVYMVATRYQTGVALTSGAIALSTLAAVVTTSVWLWLLGLG